MPKLSKRVQRISHSPIRKLTPFAEKAEEKGRKIYYLNIGQPDIETPKIVIDSIRNFDEKILSYTNSAGTISLRKKLIDYYKYHNIDLDISNILVTIGGSEAISFSIAAIADLGDDIIVPEPFYANYNTFLESSGANIIPVKSSINDSFSLPNIDDIESKITDKTRAILICNPSNPTGYLYSKKELLQLRKLVIKHNLFLVCDEVYREFVYKGKHTSILNIPGLEKNAIMIDSMSKKYSMCGARVGCIVSRNEELISMILKFSQARLSVPSVEQIASEAALSLRGEYFEEIREQYRKRRDFLVKALNKIDGVFCPKPQGAFYCMVKLPVEDTDHFAKWLLEDFSLENETIMLAPANGFYSDDKSGKNEVRIAYVLNISDLKRSVKILKKALLEYSKI